MAVLATQKFCYYSKIDSFFTAICNIAYELNYTAINIIILIIAVTDLFDDNFLDIVVQS